MKKTRRSKKVKGRDNIFIYDITLSKRVCPNCMKKKKILYYEIKDKLWGKSLFKLYMCRECLEELWFKLKDEPKKNLIRKDITEIVSNMLGKKDHVHQESKNK